MSLITTLIPAYNPDFLLELFAGLQCQTFRDFRVIVCDDSPRHVISDRIHGGLYSEVMEDIDLIVEPGGGGLWKNHQRALDLWAGSSPLVHILMDDDVIYPDFYREHVILHQKRRISASVSLRWLARKDGSPFGMLPLPAFVLDAESRAIEVSSVQLFEHTIVICENWLGELSNMVLSAGTAARFPRPPTTGVSYFGLPDIGLLLSSVDEGPILFLRDHLSIFRRYEGQSTTREQTPALKIAFVAWVAFALTAWEQKRITEGGAKQSIAIAAQRCYPKYANDADMRIFFDMVSRYANDLPQFKEHFSGFWQRLLASNPDTRP